MAQYTLLDPVTGHRWIRPEAELTRNLRPGCILLCEDEHIGIITHRDLVLFTRWCADRALARLEGKPDRRAVHALALVDQWLEDERSVTPKELDDAVVALTLPALPSKGNVRSFPWAVARAASWAAFVTGSVDRALVAISQLANDASWIVSHETQAQWLAEHLRSGK